MARINILHLTDIHIGYNFVYDKVGDLAIRIVNEIERAGKKADLVLASGDIFDGRAVKEINEDTVISKAMEFFEKLLERLKRLDNSLKKEDFVFLMGNHDLKRDDLTDQFSVFRKFLLKFYGDESIVYGMYNKKHLYCLKKFEKPKVILMGLNSSKIEKETYTEKDLEWLKKIEFDSIAGVSEKTKEKIIEKITEAKKADSEEKWYDYGYIELDQITDAIDELKEKVDSLEQYNIVVSFHHHIHPFPELYGKTGDITLIKNFEQVIERLQTLNVRLVLHGHKHVPLIRPIANDKYLNDPDSMIYVTAGGNIGSKNLPDRYFQMVEVFGKEDKSKIAKIMRFQFRQEKAEPPLDILIPPRPVEEEAKTQKLKEIIELEKSALLRKYESEIEERDNISREKGIEKILEGLGNILTSFKIIKSRLYDSPEEAMWIILFVHYRILTLNNTYGGSKPKRGKNKIILDIKEFYKKESKGPDDFSDLLFGFIGAKDTNASNKYYDNLHDYHCNDAQKRIVAYAVVASFFTDLYMVLNQYADIHYRKIDHKINIKLEEDTFHQNVPSNHIIFSCDADRRSVVVRLKSKDPTSHKIAVLFIKDFEIEMAKYEKEFDEIGLKTYYIVPKVEKEKGKYELDDYNFEAYIPTLLPLLIGEKLYRQKEVFIRELVQNAMDAILLREDLLKKEGKKPDFDKTINIQFGMEKSDEKLHSDRKEPVFYIKVIDNGVGMDAGHIERYFIHIGRSYYISHEFDELVEKKKTTYKPVSRFGIGFLTSFLVSREIRVQTKSHLPGVEGLDIYIPNHEGCFFINKDEKLPQGGTTVTLYEDPGNPIDIDAIFKYIERTFLDLPIDIKISGINKKNNGVSKTIKSFKLRRKLAKAINRPVFFIPLMPEGIGEADYNESKLPTEAFGIIFQYDPDNGKDRGDLIELNAGIKLSQGSGKYLEKNFFATSVFNIYVNYPPNYIELDVSREKINSFKRIENIRKRFNDSSFKNEIFGKVGKQILQWLQLIKNEGAETSIHEAYQVVGLVRSEKKIEIDDFSNFLYCLKLTPQKDSITLSFVPYAESISKTNKESSTKEFFFYDFEDSSSNLESLKNLFPILFELDSKKNLNKFFTIIDEMLFIRKREPFFHIGEKLKKIETILDFRDFFSSYNKREEFSPTFLSKEFSRIIDISQHFGRQRLLFSSDIDLEKEQVATFFTIFIYLDYLFHKYSYKDIKEKKPILSMDMSIFENLKKFLAKKRKNEK